MTDLIRVLRDVALDPTVHLLCFFGAVAVAMVPALDALERVIDRLLDVLGY